MYTYVMIVYKQNIDFNASSFELTDGANHACPAVFIMCPIHLIKLGSKHAARDISRAACIDLSLIRCMCPFQAYSIASQAKKVA